MAALASEANLPAERLEAIEAGTDDPPASVIERVAAALHIPAAWLFIDPKQIELLFTDADGERRDPGQTPDPVLEQILRVSRENRELYVLLTTLLQRGEPKLWRAAEMNLRSLIKQARQATVPWESRPPGHFEPPSD